MSVNYYVKQELARFKEENETLRGEIEALKRYTAATQAFLHVIDRHDPQTELVALLDSLLTSAQALTESEEGLLLVLDEDSNHLVFVLSRDDVTRQIAGLHMPVDKGVAGRVLEDRKPLILHNVAVDDRYFAGMETQLAIAGRSVLAAPIMGRGRILGVIEMIDKREGASFSTVDQDLLGLLCHFAGQLLYWMIQQDEAEPKTAGPGVSPTSLPSE